MELETSNNDTDDQPGYLPKINKTKNQLKIDSCNLLLNESKEGALRQLTDFLEKYGGGDGFNEYKGAAPTIPINDLRGDDAGRYSREERLLRCQLAAFCRLVDLNGWTQSIYNHLSARCSPNADEFLINPFGLLYHEVQASTLIKVDEGGIILDPGSTLLGINKVAWTLQSAFHSARSDVNCVVHVHLPDVIAVSCIKSGLLSTSSEATELLNTFGVRYHVYRGILMDESEVASVREDLGSAKIMFLRSKGAAVAASTVAEAWYLVKRLVTACQTQMRLLQLGGAAALISELAESIPETILNDNAENISRPFNSQTDENGNANITPNHSGAICNGGDKSSSVGIDVPWGIGEMEFEAQMRMLDSAGFRTGYSYRNPNLLRRQPTGLPWSTPSSRTATGADFFSTTDMSGGELSGMDDVAAATSAGATHMARISDTVKAQKSAGVQRQQFLDKFSKIDTAPLQSTPQTKASPDSLPLGKLTLAEKHETKAISPVDYKSTNSTPPKRTANASKSKIGEDSMIAAKSLPANRSATLPASARDLVRNKPSRDNKTLETVDGIASDDDEVNRMRKKQRTKWGSFRFPTFTKKKKRAV